MSLSVRTQPAVRRTSSGVPHVIDKGMRVVIWLTGALAILIVALIFLFLLRDTLPVFKTVSLWSLLTGADWA